VVKLVALLAEGAAAPSLACRHLVCAAEPSNAILAALAGAPVRPQRHAGVVLAWPADARERAAAESALASRSDALHAADEVRHWDELGADDRDAVLLCYFVRRRADLSFDAFRTHYRERHAPLARVHHPGIARYVQNFAATGAAADGVDAVSELWFRSEADARTRFYRDEESRRVIAEDVQRFLDPSGGSALVARPLRRSGRSRRIDSDPR
jgi:uncharacterized protein (TIGR02118 family)